MLASLSDCDEEAAVGRVYHRICKLVNPLARTLEVRMLSVNADDWGLDEQTTDRILSCFNQERVHSASAMVFVRDSERAAELARERDLPVGLHLNLTYELTGRSLNWKLREHHDSVAAYVTSRKVNQVVFNPFLHRSFEYVFRAQWDEFTRLYGEEPTRLDGHHHMHLSANMLFSGRVPKGIRFRRNFTFRRGEKDPLNRLYRHLVDRWLASRFRITDYFFSIIPINRQRLERIVGLSKSAEVELMVHPGLDEEHRFLMGDEWGEMVGGI